ncbi:MAG TPA: tetratricopeptide repeat protein [Cytophagaceae bacterium]|nr:tetratricopeptide repeat protein [Cytophagaceae bacterium]
MIDQLLQRAHLLLEQKRYKEAEKELQNVLSTQPTNEEAHSLMAIIKNQTGDYNTALQHIHAAISVNPGAAFLHYIKANILLNEDNISEARKSVLEAITLDPAVSDFYGTLASIEMQQKNWQKALDYANTGLGLEPDNLQCLNIRSTALIKLDKKEESYDTIKEALYYDPDNSYTHANLGWGLLEKGEQQKSLDHFKKALQSDPNNSYAKAGMVEALKARFWVYRMFLKYAFWISNMKGNMQWIVMIGFFFGSRVLRSLASSYPSLSPYITPIVILYTIFALSTWLIRPVSNLFLRLNPYGRYALTREEIQSSNFVGISLLVGFIATILYFITNAFPWLALAIYGVTMIFPLSSMYDPVGKKGRMIVKFYTIGLAVLGGMAVMLVFTGSEFYYLFGLAYMVGVFIYQWVVNAFVIS